ncbi:DUF1134 domain-containing protein [Acuticoccus sp. M5D2P5]|uniref:DUF1134 domain-containing protein n=1 Tax=Acuticoccus kalidii TaxID=2910977 RepID=UPI001F410ECE|nr:DUF1134 domain-containing protein [Acuticoccus kalidii]MCF3931860.1 DUF1134 domain-containing protein [Acuticoccus kalidii]
MLRYLRHALRTAVTTAGALALPAAAALALVPLAAPVSFAANPAYPSPQGPPSGAAGGYESAPGGSETQLSSTYNQEELLEAGHTFFGQTSGGLAQMIENLLSRFGEPNAYILGEEASGAIFGGLRYGEGTLSTRTMGNQTIYWQGPSMGWDLGGAGSRVMMLVYDLPSTSALMQRFTGVDGSAYLVGGLSMTVMAADSTYLIPVRTGVGARLGVSLGYLKFTSQPTWNPF